MALNESNNQKKVLIDLTSLDDNFSGIEHYALLITRELIKNKNLSFHLVFKNKVSYISEEELAYENVSHTILNGSRKKILLFSLSKYIDSYRPDYALFLAFPPSLLWKPKHGTKVISMIHDMVAFDVPKTMKYASRVYFKRSILHALKISDEIITNSYFSKGRILHYKKKFDPNKIHVTYCGSGMVVQHVPFMEIKDHYQLPDKYLLALSTVEPRKNFDRLVKWLDRVWDENPNVYDLVIVGRKGWKVDKLLENVKNINRIHFTGFVDDKDISSIYANASCFIFPSIYEGFGVPILESIIAHKLPLCSSIDVFKELLGDDYPFLFDYQSEEQFINKLNEYLACPTDKIDQLYNDACERIQNFTWDKAAKVIEELFI